MVTTMARVRAENAFSCIKFRSQATARPPMTTCIIGVLEKILTLGNSGLMEVKKPHDAHRATCIPDEKGGHFHTKWIIEGRRMKGGRLTHERVKLAAILFDITMNSAVNFYLLHSHIFTPLAEKHCEGEIS
jgi:hypothetical protein